MKLTDEQLILAIITTKTHSEAAKQLQITPQTLCSRIKQPSFKKKFEVFQRQRFEENAARLITTSQKAVDKLESLLDSENELTQYSAAKTLLQYGNETYSLYQIEKRLTALEDQNL